MHKIGPGRETPQYYDMAKTLTPLINKLNSFSPLTDAEIHFLERLDAPAQDVARHTVLVDEGERQEAVHLFLNGWACHYKILENGRRQIVGFPVPGDIAGMRSMVSRTSDVALSTLSPCRICTFSHGQIGEIFDRYANIAFALLSAMARDEAIVIEHLINLGRRTALQRMAHFMLETFYRLRLVGIGMNNAFDCALTQDDLGDALGLSSVHVNRVLRSLRERNLLTFQHGRVVIPDPDKLAIIADFDPAYLGHPEGDEH